MEIRDCQYFWGSGCVQLRMCETSASLSFSPLFNKAYSCSYDCILAQAVNSDAFLEKGAPLTAAQDALCLLCESRTLWEKAKQEGEDAKKKLAATKLTSTEFHQWFVETTDGLQSRVRENYVCQEKKVLQANHQATAVLSKIPCVKDETKYREVLSGLISSMATQSQKLKKMALDLEATLKTLAKATSFSTNLAGRATGPGHSKDKEEVGATDEHFKEGILLSRVLAVHVSFFAALTLLRSPGVGGKSDKSKKTAKQLEGVLGTLLQTDLPALPSLEALPDEVLEKVLHEMEGAVAWLDSEVGNRLREPSSSKYCDPDVCLG